jgi:biopolymer transport protein ExbB/TolQ
MEINLMELWGHMGFAVRCVVVLLTIQAVACVAVAFDRLYLLLSSAQRARQFAANAQASMEAADYGRVLAAMQEARTNHLTSYLELGLRTFLSRNAVGDTQQRAAELARRALERKGDAISRDLNRGMNILASTGSTAPFVGLLGTVLGILNAFKLIATSGSGGLGTIGGAIAEALIVTGYGLMVAIPAVLAFNYLAGRIANYEAGLINAGMELIDRLETQNFAPAAPAREPVSGRPPMPRTAPVRAG